MERDILQAKSGAGGAGNVVQIMQILVKHINAHNDN